VADELTVVTVYPELLGTYGDRGNALALAHRAAARGIPVRLLDVAADEPLPRGGDVYLLGGGEDSSQLLAARSLLADDRAHRVLASAPCLAVCAGLQIMARTFDDADGRAVPGLGLLDVTCGRLGARAVGEVVSEPYALPGVPTFTGFENHRGGATLGADARPLGRVVAGVGNGDRYEGAVQGSTIATYLHGPVLVRNPDLADLLLSRAVGSELPAFVDRPVDQLRTERLDAADPRRHRSPSWLPRLGRTG
jgi:lipid II isoglutaminyl synthase (glutamine-hydrolysing)